jgi:hypothetical protein
VGGGAGNQKAEGRKQNAARSGPESKPVYCLLPAAFCLLRSAD